MRSTTGLTGWPAAATAGGRAGGGAAIACEGLVRIFKADGVEVVALQGLDLLVEPGELVAVVGASGSGKSTLLSILSGLDVPTAGSARVAGQDLLALSRRERVAFQRHTVGFVWQQTGRNLLPYLTAVENVALPMVVSRVPRAERARRAGDLLELLGVAPQSGSRPSEMSGGQQQRVAIAVAVANAPQVLLADEPTGELDTATSAEVLAAFWDANAELGVTVLVVTHDPLVSDHVGVPLRLTRRPPHERERRVAELLDLVGLAGAARQRPYELSGGQQQRVAIARALANEPRLLVADEPTGQLDSGTGRAVMELVRRLVDERGVTAVVATHDPLLVALADHVVELSDGRVVADGDPSTPGVRCASP